MLRLTPVALALGVVWGAYPLAALAQDTPEQDNPTPVTRLKEVTVTATRTPRRVDNVPSTVTVTPQQHIEQNGARSIKDALADELDVSVRAAPTRFTAAGPATGRADQEGINIRGLEGNQVLMLTDGIRVPNSFSFASFSTGRGDFLEVDGLKSIEILRGPASTQFGSDGLAGAVSLRTLDPADVLKGDQTLGGFARASYATADHAWAETLSVAARNDKWQGLLLASLRQGHETDNKGSNDSLNTDRTRPNPLDTRSHYLLGKAILSVNAAHQLGATVETQRRKQDTEVYSARAKAPLSATSTLDLDTQDHIDRDRISLEHRFSDPNAEWVQRTDTKLYWQDAQVNQLSIEDRNTAADRTRDNTYTARVLGLSSQFESNFTRWVNQRVIYGLDWSQTKSTGTRDGTVPPGGETFPTKPFPDTTYTLLGAFAQSEIEVGAISVIPGLRFDRYDLNPSSEGYTGGNAAKLSDQAVTPRLGAVWRVNPAVAPYAQWARGFRAPTPDQVNNGFTNLAQGYKSIGNPDLKAERANSFELGLRGQIQAWRYTVSAYDNQYDDFISQQVVSGSGTPANPTVYQYINLSQAHIRGLEARSEWAFRPHWLASAGLAYAKGDSEVNGQKTPLDTINPLKAVITLRYDTEAWGARANVVHSHAKEADRVGPLPATPPATAPVAAYVSPSYTVLDLGGHWKPTRNLTLNANLNNVLNTRYWRWSDVRGLADSSTVKEAYTAPGRNLQVSVRYDY